LNIAGTTVDAQLSHWGTSLEQTVALAMASVSGGKSSTNRVFLAGGATADLVIHRPAGSVGQTVTVDITAAPHADAVLAGLLWTMTKKLNPQAAATADLVNCAFHSWPPVDLADVNVLLEQYQDCVKPILSVQGLELLPVLDTILTADGIGQKLLDVYTDETYPPHLVLSLTADAALTISVTTANLADAVLAQPYVGTLTAIGGSAPYAWSIATGTLPAGLSLSAAGSISGTPSALGSTSFTVTVRDSAGATAAGALTLAVIAGTIKTGTVSAGTGHSCAVTTGGAVKCWGWNLHGQLGNGTTTDSSTPVDVVGLGAGVAAVSAGGSYSCAVTNAGAAKCWGLVDGGIASGTTTESHTPVDVVGLGSGVASVTVGDHHACAVTTGGALKCWGFNGWGQLGDGTTTQSSADTLVDVVGLGSGVAAVTTGTFRTCALTTSGAVKCWGYNGSGALGDGRTTASDTPVDVVGLGSGVAAVSADGEHSCAVTSVGAVKCWGRNVYGELGDATITSSSTPVDVVGLVSGVAAVTAGNFHSCALSTGGAVVCWGLYKLTASTTPVGVFGLGSGVAEVDAGGMHTCVVTTSGAVKCWGQGDYGDLGNGTTTDSVTPVSVIGFP